VQAKLKANSLLSTFESHEKASLLSARRQELSLMRSELSRRLRFKDERLVDENTKLALMAFVEPDIFGGIDGPTLSYHASLSSMPNYNQLSHFEEFTGHSEARVDTGSDEVRNVSRVLEFIIAEIVREA
jgi:hypothetical protein